ncbi:GntR family transcriptional regulator [Aurantimonas sp. 22II-16-19i]|uniref:GntR family transcriptional regulator n=1 Tax=Aurantimonas sp. 22II-16-19i TaxID=1317114 RepID=UPI0009F7EC54|nr:GntR family transcriptional regulator [Aurantimonas sp. 22II-16-19i]ORE90480.1 GntR family transcriptional regulator [Aurantimonas sp. 22II-16-19i]
MAAASDDETTGGRATRPAGQRAYAAIRAGILGGAFPPGGFIEEGQACELTGVSRTPVREALTRLAAEGFVELHPRRGAMVRPLLGSELRDLLEVRRMIESHAIRRICEDRRAVPGCLYGLCETREAASVDDLLTSVEINTRFHHGIVEAAGNGVLTKAYEGLHASLGRASMLSLQMKFGDSDLINQEHRELLDALSAHDAEAALAVLQRHLRPIPQLMAVLPA